MDYHSQYISFRGHHGSRIRIRDTHQQGQNENFFHINLGNFQSAGEAIFHTVGELGGALTPTVRFDQ
jgi:hypothetical protein